MKTTALTIGFAVALALVFLAAGCSLIRHNQQTIDTTAQAVDATADIITDLTTTNSPTP